MSVEVLMKSLDKIEGSMQRTLTNQAELADRVTGLEQRASIPPTDASTRRVASLGDQVVEGLRKHGDLLARTKSLRLEGLTVKAAGDAITTTSGRRIVTGGVGAPYGGVLGLQNALSIRPAGGTSAVEYSRYTGQQGAAGVQAGEGAAKAAVRPDHSLIVQSALTIAGYTKMSRQAMNDSAELRAAVDVTLARSVATALDVALVDGNVSPAFDGFSVLATAATSATYDTLPDAVSEGVSVMQTAGFNPDVVALNPSDWLAITVAKGTSNDHYLSGSYLGVMPMELRGLRVVLSPSVDAGKALVMDSAHAELLIVDGFTVEIAYSGDDFVKNLATILGEMRVIPIFRTVGSARLITPAP
jgi:HK97 family phage major capsid protein